jgi:hypothetical protein
VSDGVTIAAAIATCAWLLLLEWRRADRRRLAGRVGASLIAVGALAALALAPALPRRALSERIVLITEGARAGAARGIADSVPARHVVSLDTVGDLARLRRGSRMLSDLVVIGWGLPSHELTRARGLSLEFVPAPLPEGLRGVDWPSRIVLGEAATIVGSAAPAAWIRIAVDGVFRDSTRAARDGSFELRFTPRAAGLQLFALHAGGTADTGAIDVRPRRPPSVLIVEGAPDFELAHLRRWLAASGARVGMRTTLSRGRERTYALNGAASPGPKLTADLLRSFDVLIIDEDAARALSRAELELVRTAVAADGLGILLTGERPRLDGLVAAPARAAQADRTIRVRKPASGELSPPVSSIPLLLEPGAAGQTILEAANRRAVATVHAAGAGRVGLSAIRNPGRWLLEGEESAFGHYWTTMLTALERPRDRWESPASLPGIVGHPFRISWPARLDTAFVAGPSGVDTLFLTPDADSLAWSADFWPRHPGRHRAIARGDTLALYVTGAGTWHAARAAARANATTLHAALNRRESASPPGRVHSPLAPWMFMLMFTVSAGWLWWEGRQCDRGGKEGRTGVG